jgi:TrmH RNA methyltransferase
MESKASGPRKTVGKDEQRYYGKRQCMALFATRPLDIINIHLVQTRVREFAPLLKWCAERKKAYHICDSAELEKMARSQHHEGIVILARKRFLHKEAEFFELIQKQQPRQLVHLNGVENPHNLGAMLRSAAFFGLHHISIENPEGLSLPAASCRVAEGGAEEVEVAGCRDSVEHLQRLQAMGYRVVCLENNAKTDLSRLDTEQATVVVLGAEDTGIHPDVLRLADQSVRISGNGKLSSLNVASAASIVFHHLACH